MREEAYAFDCETCTAPERLEELDPDNREAWQLFGQIVTRLAVDVPGAAGAILARVVSEKSGEDAAEFFQRLSAIYDAINPPKES